MVTELSFVSFALAALQAPPQESKWLPEFVHHIPLWLWIAIGVAGLVILVIILYYFTIDEIELAIPPKIKFKRRVSAVKEAVAARVDSATPPATSQTVSDQATAPPITATIQPNLVHPYPLQSNFTGRVKERAELTAWLMDDEHPIYELVAIGGMGKSALTWVWLTHDVVLSQDLKLDGVMWWSFYEGESSFGKFVDDALKYVSGESTIDEKQFPTTYDRAQELRKLLQNKRVLFVLDGFERQLRAYASLDAAYKSHDAEPSAEARSCVDPITSRLLRDIAAVTTRAKILLTSRLAVSDLEDRAGDPLAGVVERELKAISLDDAIAFMRAQGVAKGTDAEIANACEGYGYHGLSLRLLSGLIAHDAKMPGDIRAAPRHEVYDDLVQRQHHVLEQSYNAMPKRERALLSRIAAFRGPMTYEALSIFNTLGSEKRFEEALADLRVRGVLQRDEENNRYDLHPVVRRYAYDRLSGKTGVHDRLREYFAEIPVPDKDELQSLEDLTPVIELYHHTVRAGLYDEAQQLFYNRLHDPLYYRFGSYRTQIELLRTLFPDGEDRPPRLKKRALAFTMNALANSYSLSGQPRSAVRAFQSGNEICEQQDDTINLAIGLGNIAFMAQVSLGRLADAEQNLRRSIKLCRDTGTSFWEASAHHELARLLAYSSRFDEAAQESDVAIGLIEEQRETQAIGTIWAYAALRALLIRDAPAALEAAQQSRTSAYLVRNEYDIILAEWLLGAALVMGGEDLNAAANHLTEALTRCRRISLVEVEPDILLAWARWHLARGNPEEAHAHADEALLIADRCEYRLKQADIHNFLARLALDAGDRETARKEAEIAKERAWCDGPPHCYKPALDEAEKMLKELGAK